jgi:putative tryptophan/tyrosine transport system substrate-binding protein
MIRRRQFIAGLGGEAAWPLVARAEQQAMPVVGYLQGGAPERTQPIIAAFRRGLAETGFVEGRNVVNRISPGKWATGQSTRRSRPSW